MNRPLDSASLVVTLVLAGFLVGGAWSPQVGLAATRIGPDVNAVSSSSIGCSTDSLSATCSNAALTGGALVTSPIDGVVVRWRVKVNNGTSTATFRILRNVSPGVFTGAGSSSPSPPFGSVGDFPARLPIRAGDRIGVDLPPFLGPCAQGCLSVVSGGSTDIWRPPLADGASPGSSPSFVSGATVLINADVEPDADGDAFGDETQDKCPAVQGVDAGCPPLVNEPPRATPPQVTLSGSRLQNVLAQGAVTVFVTSTEAGSVVATGTINIRGRRKVKIGTLTPASSNLAPGAETRLRLKLSRKARKEVHGAHEKGKKLKAVVTASVESAGGSTVANRTVQIKGPKRTNP